MIDNLTNTETSVSLFDIFQGLHEIVEWERKFRNDMYRCFTFQGNYIVRKNKTSYGTYTIDGLMEFCNSL